MCSFKAVVYSHVDGVSAQSLHCGHNGDLLILLKNDGNNEVVQKPLPLYLLPVGTRIKEGGPAVCLIPADCDLVYVDVVGSELKHISGKNALEVLVYGPEGSEFHKKFCCWVVGVLAPTPKPTLATLHVSLFLYITNSAASDVLAAETKP